MSYATSDNVPQDEMECNEIPSTAEQKAIHNKSQRQKRELWEDSKPPVGLDWQSN